jgi:hypothetical protein
VKSKIKDENYDEEEGLKKLLIDLAGVMIGLFIYIILQTAI